MGYEYEYEYEYTPPGFFSRPRLLYVAVYCWIAATGGRFTATFLESESSHGGQDDESIATNRLDPSQIGLALAIQRFVGVFAGSLTGIWADRLEKMYPNRGRLLVLVIGCCLGSLVFLLHGTHRCLFQDMEPSLTLPSNNTSGSGDLNAWAAREAGERETTVEVPRHFFQSFPWFVSLRIAFAICTSLVFPILDGICLDFLKKQQQQRNVKINCDKNQGAATDDYGKERLFGAISWALTNLLIGPMLDYCSKKESSGDKSRDKRNEFWIFYPLTIASTGLLVVAVWIYSYSVQRHSRLGRTPDNALGRLQSPKQNESTIFFLPDIPCEDDFLFEENDQSDSEGEMEDNESRDLFYNEPYFVNPTAGTDESEKESTIRHYWSIFSKTFGASAYTVAFLICLVGLSSGQAIVNDLVFLFFESALSSSYTFMSMTVLLTVFFEIPIFRVAPTLLRTLGTNALLVVASLSYVVRVIGYSLVPAEMAWVALLLEPLHGVTYASSQTAAVDFVSTKLDFSSSDMDCPSKNTPDNGNNRFGSHKTIENVDSNRSRGTKSYPKRSCGNDGKEATGQGFLQFFVGIGSVLGLVLGGYAEDYYGPRVMYRISAGVVSIACLCFVAVLLCPVGIAAAINIGTTVPARTRTHRRGRIRDKTIQQTDHDKKRSTQNGMNIHNVGKEPVGMTYLSESI